MRASRALWGALTAGGWALSATGCVGIFASSTEGEGDGTGEGQSALCADAPTDVGASPMRRLTSREYNNAIRDLTGDDRDLADGFVPDESMSGFAANAVAPISKLQLQDYVMAAEDIAARVVTETHPEVVGCDLGETSCVESFVQSFGRRAFRRPVPEELQAELIDVYTAGRAAWGDEKAFELVLQSILLSPYFLYHVELTLPDEDDAQIALLNDYEVASRLSFFLWQTVPDEALLAAADAGQLATAEGIAEQAVRMIEDDRAREGVEAFIGQWLEVEDMDELLKDDAFPAWSPEVAAAMQRETLTFADNIFRGGGDLSELLTAPYTYGDATLAELYDAPAPDEAFGRIDLDPKTRGGLLTQGSFLASRAHATEPSWVFRGKFVREQLLCDPLPPPPPGVDMNQSNDPDRLTNPECKGCHTRMDPIGHGFDQYDAIGQFITGEAGIGEIIEGGEASGEFSGPVELGATLAESPEVRACVAKHVFRYAARRAETDEDSCSMEAIDAHFADEGATLSELLIGIATSDAFRYRRIQD